MHNIQNVIAEIDALKFVSIETPNQIKKNCNYFNKRLFWYIENLELLFRLKLLPTKSAEELVTDET